MLFAVQVHEAIVGLFLKKSDKLNISIIKHLSLDVMVELCLKTGKLDVQPSKHTLYTR